MPGQTENARLKTWSRRASAGYFLAIFLPILALLGGILWLLYNNSFKSEMALIEAESALTLSNDGQIIIGDLVEVLEDLYFFANHYELQEYFDDPASKDEDLAQEYLTFALSHGHYDQIRLISIDGTEVIRINDADKQAYIVPQEELQNKSDRYYFQETVKLQPGEVYVSIFDLNVENGEIEQPLKPVIRFGTPVFDDRGNLRGVVMLNYLGSNLIDKLHLASRDIFQTMLINKDGYFLIGLRPEDEWGFMYEDGGDLTFANMFPAAQAQMSLGESGTFSNDEGLFGFIRVYPSLSVELVNIPPSVPAEQPIRYRELYWTLVNYVSPDDIAAVSNDLLSGYALIFGIAAVLLAIAAGITASAVARRRMADIALRESEARYRDLANLLPQIVFEVDARGYLTFLNKAAFRLLKYEQEDIERGLAAADMILPEEREKLQANIEQLAAGEEVTGVEYEVRRRDGSMFPVMMYFTPVLRGERLGGFRGMAVDITELKRIDRMKTEFISVASHELKSPLASIYGFVKLLQEKDTGETNETQREFLGIIETQTNLLTSLVNDLLDVARIESGRFNLDISEVDIGEVIGQVIATLKPQAQERQVSLETDFRYQGGKIMADRNRLVQIFFNLLSNAIKYNREEGWVKITTSQVEDLLQVDVADNGLGIPEGDIPSLFTKFFRAENAYKSQAGGTGLGLHIARSIIEMHGGKIWLESKEDKGSTFSFTLPISQKENEPAAAP